MKILENNDIKYEKLKIVIDKINYIEDNFNLILYFDRRRANHYKILIKDKEYTFNTYDSVISALDLIIDLEGGLIV